MPRAFVTGATGFVGQNLVGQLRKQGWEVTALVRDANRAAPLESLGATATVGHLADSESLQSAMNGAGTVFHVAGRVRALREQEFIADNVEGTRHVLEAAAAQPAPPVVVLVSSLAAGGPSQPGAPRRESDDDRPVSAYGKSKLAAERVAAEFADRVPVSIIRPPIIFGPADKASLAIFRGVKLTRLHPVPGLRVFPVSIVHVTDLCDAMIRLAERGERVPAPRAAATQNGDAHRNTGVYYISAERTISYAELGKLAARALGCAGFALPLPKSLFWIAGGVAEVAGRLRQQPGVLNLDKIREALAPGWECDDTKLRDTLGYEPAAPLEKRFAETAAWYRQQGWV